VSSSIAFSVSGSVNAGSTATVSWTTNSSVTKYINSTGVDAYPRVTPKAQSVGTGTYNSFLGTYLGSFTATFQEPIDHFNYNPPQAVASLSVNYTLRTGNTGGTILATSNTVTVYATPGNPTSLASQTITNSSITMRVSGGTFGTLQIKRGSGSYQNADSNGDVTFTGLSAGTSYTFTARRVNGTHISSTISATVSTSSTPTAPTVNPSISYIDNGFNLQANPSSTDSSFSYKWSSSTYSGSFSSSPNLGVGVSWEGVTWTVTPRVTSGGVNYDGTPQSVTVPSISVSAPASIVRGTATACTTSTSNAIGGTLYWAVTPANQFTTSQGTVGENSSFSITASSSSTATSGTVSVYVHSSRGTLDLVGSDSFSITDPEETITTPSAPTVSSDNAELANVQVTVQLPNGDTSSGGTLQFGQSTTNSAPSSWSTGSFATFSHPRNDTRYYWARRSANNVSSSTSLNVPYLTTFDSSVTISPSTRQVSDGDASATFTITNPSGSNTLFANSVYRLVTSSISSGWRASKAGESDGTADIVLNQSEGDLPPEGTAATYTYQLSGKRRDDKGGPPNNDSEFTDISGESVTVERLGSNESISPASMNEGASQAFTTANNKLSNLQNSTTYYWKAFAPTAGPSDFSTSQGSFTTDSSGNTSGFTLSTVSDSVTEGAETATIRIYTSSSARNADDGTATSGYAATATFTINDTSTGASGGSGGPGGGSANYGLVVRNANYSSNILSPSQRAAGLIETGTFSAAAYSGGSGGTTTITNSEIKTDNATSVVLLIAPPSGTNVTGAIAQSRSNGSITITNNSSNALTNCPYYLLRV